MICGNQNKIVSKNMKNHAKTARDGPETSPDTSESAEKLYTEQLHHRGPDPHGLDGVRWPELRTVYEGPDQG